MKDKTQTELATRFEMIKHHFKLNNSKLAEIAEVTSTAIGDIMNGTTDNPKLGLLKNVSTKLNISMEWLAYGDGEMLRNGNANSISFNKNEIDSNLIKYMRKVEFLQTVLLQNGIKVEIPNFSKGVPVSAFGGL